MWDFQIKEKGRACQGPARENNEIVSVNLFFLFSGVNFQDRQYLHRTEAWSPVLEQGHLLL